MKSMRIWSAFVWVLIWSCTWMGYTQNSTDILSSSELISVDFRESDIRDVIRSLADLTGKNIVATGTVKGKITMSLKNVNLKDALEAILSIENYKWRQKGSILIIEGAQSLDTSFHQLNYADANQIKELLDNVKSEAGTIMVDVRSNKLILRDYPDRIDEFKRLIDELDYPTPQVSIEAKILDLEVSDKIKLGLNVSTTHSHGDPTNIDEQNRTNSGFTVTDGELGQSFDDQANRGLSQSYGLRLTDVDGSTGAFGDPTNQNTTFNFVSDSLERLTRTVTDNLATGTFTSVISKSVAEGLAVQLDALIEDGKTLLLAAPTITTLNNETASIIIGEKVGIKEQTQTTTGTTETVRFEDVGTKLEVTPQINTNGYITMNIKPEISSVKTFLTDEIRFNTREARTKVRVKNHDTVIIGGLISNNESKGQRRIPIVSTIPIIGNLFKGVANSGSQRELVVFLTPHIISQPKNAMDMTSKEVELLQLQEAMAKERELLERYYSQFWEKEPSNSIAQDKSHAKKLYKDALVLKRKTKRVEKERSEKLAEIAIEKLNKVLDLYKDSKYASKSLYLMAMIENDCRGDKDKALKYLTELMDKYPNDKLYKKAKKQHKKLQGY